VDRILQKSLSVFPCLESTHPEDVVTFYDRLQEVSMNHVLALMSFDAIVVRFCFEGLCPPGLGITRYGAMSKALMELLPWLIPGTTSPQINAALALVRYESGNGYDYLWCAMELRIPGFDPATPILVPVWSGVADIFSFAQELLLYFRLQEKLNFHYDNRHRSSIFLRAIQFSEFADTATALQTQVNSFRFEYDDGFLPPHLCVHGLATSIHQNSQARLSIMATPRARRISGDTSKVQGLPSAFRVSRDRHARDSQAPYRGKDRHNGISGNDGEQHGGRNDGGRPRDRGARDRGRPGVLG
jgi:hypothetical protein